MRARRETEERVIELLVMFERMSNEYRRAHAYPKGWAGPTKHVRGNIWADDFGLSAFRWHGVARADEMPRKS